MKKKKQKLDESMTLMAPQVAVGGLYGLLPKRVDKFKFKGLPGQFNEFGEKVFDEQGNPIREDVVAGKEEDFKQSAKAYVASIDTAISNIEKFKRDVSAYSKSCAKEADKSLKELKNLKAYLKKDSGAKI